MALIYIVEDDENILEIEEIALRNANYQVSGFSTIQTCQKSIICVKLNCVLLIPLTQSFLEISVKIRKPPEYRQSW